MHRAATGLALVIASFAMVPLALADCPSDTPFPCPSVGKCWGYPVVAVCEGYHGDNFFVRVYAEGRPSFGVGIDNYGYGGEKVDGPAWPPVEHFKKSCNRLILCKAAPPAKPSANKPQSKAPPPGANPPAALPSFPLEEPAPQ